jgi:hypothetical protein
MVESFQTLKYYVTEFKICWNDRKLKLLDSLHLRDMKLIFYGYISFIWIVLNVHALFVSYRWFKMDFFRYALRYWLDIWYVDV